MFCIYHSLFLFHCLFLHVYLRHWLLRTDEDGVEVNESFTDDQTDDNRTNWPLFDQIRNQDIRLLKTLNVGTIVDFMVEKKKVKFGLK